MILNYSIKLKQEEDFRIKSNTIYTSIVCKKFSNSLYFLDPNRSLPFSISNNYILSDSLVRSYGVKKDFLSSVNYFDNKNPYKGPKVLTEDILKDLLKNSHRYNITKLDGDFYPFNFSDVSSIYLLKLENNSFVEEDPSKFSKDPVNNRFLLQEDNKYFVLNLSENRGIEATNSFFELTLEDIVDFNKGFYKILPKMSSNNYRLTKQNKFEISVHSKTILKLVSDVFINYDNCVENNFYAFPGTNLLIKYSGSDYSPLTEIDSHSSWDTSNEYVILELIDNILVPKWHLSSDNTNTTNDQRYQDLMVSHVEFKKPFFYIANKCNIDIFNKEEKVTSTLIYNKDFNALKYTQSILKIKI